MIYSETDEGKVKVISPDELKPFPQGKDQLPLEALLIEENPPK